MADGSRILGDRYELGERLGSGGMATVYAATDRVLERDVAVKVLAPNFASDEEFVERFRREARASAGLNHPNIVSVFDTVAEPEGVLIVMEYVEGLELGRLLQEEGALAVPRALAIAARIAAGLEVTLSQLLRLDEHGAVTVVRRDERTQGGTRSRGHRYEVLTPPLPGQRAEVSLHLLEPGALTAGPDDPPIHEPGSRETAVVLEGSLRLHCDGAASDLAEGDAVTFDSDLPHRFENPGTAPTRFLAVVSAGLRRS